MNLKYTCSLKCYKEDEESCLVNVLEKGFVNRFMLLPSKGMVE